MCELFSYCNSFSQKFLQVCGNDESVKLLSNWLHSWQQRGHQVCTDTYSGDVCDRQDADYCRVQSESDSENNNEGASLKNVLLITGPTGVWINSILMLHALLMLVLLGCLWKEISCGIPNESSSCLQFIKDEIKFFSVLFCLFSKKLKVSRTLLATAFVSMLYN